MALCYPCMTRHPFLFKHFGSDYSVTNIMLSAITVNGRSVGLNNADIVEHCSLVDKCSVEMKLGMGITDSQCTVGHLTAMGE